MYTPFYNNNYRTKFKLMILNHQYVFLFKILNALILSLII